MELFRNSGTLYEKSIDFLRLQWKDAHLKNSNLLNSLLLCGFIILFINFCLSLTCLFIMNFCY
jgi:hypothetical protein